MDMNDRSLRDLVQGIGGKANGIVRETGFDITAASEVMATLCLADSMANLKERLGNIVVAKSTASAPVTAKQVDAAAAMAIILKDAIKPNLVQTLDGTPAFVHGGPFANIAHAGGVKPIDLVDEYKNADVYYLPDSEVPLIADLGGKRIWVEPSMYGTEAIGPSRQ
ncbi:unnamed protein product [Rotaria sordida]|uniref:Formyltetrahydrofolate synthetase n=1 Tax=Rotaria sordida TaxID=392033 RepID=A0A813NWN7_9BILA|nr:unnamed protein product [Rotaria sordida]